MQQKAQRPVVRISLTLIAIIVLVTLVRYVLSQIKDKNQSDSIRSFAQQIGYTPDDHLTQYETCWDVFPSQCGLVLLYTTTMDRNELQYKLDRLTPAKTLAQDIDGYALFDTNRVTKHRLTVNGMDDSSNRSRTPEPVAYKWHIRRGDRNWVISFYDIGNDGHTYEFDGRQIKSNIIALLLRTK